MIDNSDLKKTLNFLNIKKNKLILTHCVSNYPTKLDSSYLSNIREIQKFNYLVGYSDHTIGTQAALAATSLNIKLIEKHITLNNNDIGPDHFCSLEVHKLKKFIEDIRDIEASIKKKKRELLKEERLTKIVAKKSLYLFQNLKKGQKIKKKDLIALRPLGTGIPVKEYKKVVNKTVNKNLAKFEQLKFKYLNKI